MEKCGQGRWNPSWKCWGWQTPPTSPSSHLHHHLHCSLGLDVMLPTGFCTAIRLAAFISVIKDKPDAFSLLSCGGPQPLETSAVNTTDDESTAQDDLMQMQLKIQLDNRLVRQGREEAGTREAHGPTRFSRTLATLGKLVGRDRVGVWRGLRYDINTDGVGAFPHEVGRDGRGEPATARSCGQLGTQPPVMVRGPAHPAVPDGLCQLRPRRPGRPQSLRLSPHTPTAARRSFHVPALPVPEGRVGWRRIGGSVDASWKGKHWRRSRAHWLL